MEKTQASAGIANTEATERAAAVLVTSPFSRLLLGFIEPSNGARIAVNLSLEVSRARSCGSGVMVTQLRSHSRPLSLQRAALLGTLDIPMPGETVILDYSGSSWRLVIA